MKKTKPLNNKTKGSPSPPFIPTLFMQIDYAALESVRPMLKLLDKTVAYKKCVQKLNSKIITDLIKNGRLCWRLDYHTGETIWYYWQRGRLEVVNDKDYILLFKDGNMQTVNENFIKNANFNISIQD